MVFTKFVEIGRVCVVTYGEKSLLGKLCVVTNVIDGNRALVDGPTWGVPRQSMNFKRLTLTDFTIDIPVGATVKTIKAAIVAADFDAKWAESTMAKKIAMKKKRSEMNDFDRFKVMIARKQRAVATKKKLKELKKASA